MPDSPEVEARGGLVFARFQHVSSTLARDGNPVSPAKLREPHFGGTIPPRVSVSSSLAFCPTDFWSKSLQVFTCVY